MTDLATWAPPRCIHGRIILGCPHELCPEQDAYIAQQDAVLDRIEEEQRGAARVLVRGLLGLPL